MNIGEIAKAAQKKSLQRKLATQAKPLGYTGYTATNESVTATSRIEPNGYTSYTGYTANAEGQQLGQSRPAITHPSFLPPEEPAPEEKQRLITYELAKKAWYDHYWKCQLCISHHTKLRPPEHHPCSIGSELVNNYNLATI